MPAQRVLRLRRSDVAGDSFVLLHIEQSGQNALDLKLSGSENEYAYVKTSRSPALSTPPSSSIPSSFHLYL
jgi:hypothetical protein